MSSDDVEKTKIDPKDVEMDLDKVLAEEIGQFGKYQAGVLALSFVIVIFSSWSANEYVFTTARINTRCHIPECDTMSPEFSPEWIDFAIPRTSAGNLNACQRYATANVSSPLPGTCPAAIFNTDSLIDCDEYVYENTNTVVYDFKLACVEWQRSLIGSIRVIGILVGYIIVGYVSDTWGRRVALLLATINTVWLGALRYFADTYVGFVISQFVEAALGSGSFSAAYILLMEIVGRKYRVACGAALTSFFSVGQITLALIAWVVPYWKNLTLALFVPQVIVIMNVWLAPESVRWFLSKGRYSELKALLQKMTRVNGNSLSPKSLELLKLRAEEEKIKKNSQREQRERKEWLVKLVFKHKAVLYRVLISPVCWITMTLIYYGLSINAVNISGNRYLNYAAVSSVEIPGYWTAVFLVNKIGRKPVLITGYWLCSCCQVAYIFISKDVYGASLAVYLVGKFSIALVVTAIYLFTAELYPTQYRHRLFAFSSMMGRIGSIVAPLTPAIGTATFYEMPFIIFAVLAFISGLLVFTVPETLGVKLPDTMEEADNIGKKAPEVECQ